MNDYNPINDPNYDWEESFNRYRAYLNELETIKNDKLLQFISKHAQFQEDIPHLVFLYDGKIEEYNRFSTWLAIKVIGDPYQWLEEFQKILSLFPIKHIREVYDDEIAVYRDLIGIPTKFPFSGLKTFCTANMCKKELSLEDYTNPSKLRFLKWVKFRLENVEAHWHSLTPAEPRNIDKVSKVLDQMIERDLYAEKIEAPPKFNDETVLQYLLLLCTIAPPIIDKEYNLITNTSGVKSVFAALFLALVKKRKIRADDRKQFRGLIEEHIKKDNKPFSIDIRTFQTHHESLSKVAGKAYSQLLNMID